MNETRKSASGGEGSGLCRWVPLDDAHRAPLQGERLRRLDRVFDGAPIYFLTTCAFNRSPIFAVGEIHRAFVDFCSNAPAFGAWVGRYVIMPDHVHLFVLVDGIPLSAWVKSLKNSLSKKLRELGRESPHWQKGFFDHVLRSGESYTHKWSYVRENPVRAGLVAAVEAWPYAGEIHDLEFQKRQL